MTPGVRIKTRLLVSALGVGLMLSSACTDPREKDDQAGAKPAAAERPDAMTAEERIAMRQKLEASRPATATPVQEPSAAAPEQGVTGEVPEDLLDRILGDLETQTGANRADFEILQASAAQWNDGALGCPRPGENYTQAIVDGYRVVVGHAGETYDYHASASGYFKLCAGFRPDRQQYPTM